MSDSTVAAILSRIARLAYATAQEAYWQFGDGVGALLKHGSMSWAIQKIQATFPNAKAEIGYALSKSYLTGAHALASAFHAEGGLVSPDGKHRVSRAQLDTLGLQAEDKARMGSLLAYAAQPKLPKGVHRLRVSDIASAITAMANAKTPAEQVGARQRLLDRMTECEASMVAATSARKADLIAEQIRVAESKVGKAEEQLAKAKAELAQLRAQLKQELADEKAAAAPKDGKSIGTARTAGAGKGRKRSQRTISPAQVASVASS